MPAIQWTDYLRYRAKLRGYDVTKLDNIIRHSEERYFDTETERAVVVGRHEQQLVIIPYEVGEADNSGHSSCYNTSIDSLSTENWEIYP